MALTGSLLREAVQALVMRLLEVEDGFFMAFYDGFQEQQGLAAKARGAEVQRALADSDVDLLYLSWETAEFEPSVADVQRLADEYRDPAFVDQILGGYPEHYPARQALNHWDVLASAFATLEGLGRSVYAFSRHPAAQPSQIEAVIANLLRQDDGEALTWLAKDCRCPSEMLSVLSRHPSEQVRQCVVGNPSTSIETLGDMTRDSSLVIAAEAVRRTRDRSGSTLADALLDAARVADVRGDIVQVLPSHPAIPVEGLRIISARVADEVDAASNGEGSWWSAAPALALSLNPRTPNDALDLLRSRDLLDAAFYNAGRGIRLEPRPLEPFSGSWDQFVTGSQDDCYERSGLTQDLVLSESQLLDLARSPAVILRLASVCHVGATPTVASLALDGLLSDDLF